MEKSFEIRKIQMESSVVAQKHNSPRKEFILKTREISPQLSQKTHLLLPQTEPWSDVILFRAVPDGLVLLMWSLSESRRVLASS